MKKVASLLAFLAVATMASANPHFGTGTAVVVGTDALGDAKAVKCAPEVKEWCPIEKVNRLFFKVNNVVDCAVIHPVGYVWNKVTPKFVRTGVTNVIDNVETPLSAANNLLQFKPRAACAETQRFLINSTLGIAGLFKVAKCEPETQTFANTLGVWGVRPMLHTEVPVTQQTSNLRDASANIGVDVGLAALTSGWWAVVSGAKLINNGEAFADARYQMIQDNPTDPYAAVRDNYEAKRAEAVAAAKQR